MEFDAKSELAQLQAQKTVIRKRRFSRSRLDKFKSELLALKSEGATVADLQRWLRSKRVKVAYSTVSRWVAKHG